MPRTVDPNETNFGEEELDENEEGLEGEEEEELEEEEEDEDDPESIENRRARGDFVEEGEEEEEADLESLQSVAGDGRGNKLYPRIQELTAENRRLAGLIEQAATRGLPAATEKQEPAEPAFDMEGKLKARAEAQLEGDIDKIVAIDIELEAHRLKTATAAATAESARTVSVQLQKQRLDDEVGRGFAKFPFLNDENENHNPEALSDVVMYRNRYISEGLEPHVALRKAINKVGPMYAEGGGGEDPPDNTVKKTQKSNILRNAKLAQRIPARTSSVGVNGARNTSSAAKGRSAHGMPSGEYEALSEKEKARLRGDIVSR